MFAYCRRWHADIKPDNILIVEEEDALGNTYERFKLADPGFAKFVPKTFENKDLVQRIQLDGGTKTYGNLNPLPARAESNRDRSTRTAWSHK